MNLKLKLAVTALMLSFGGIANADEACNAQLAAKDLVIQQLTQMLASRVGSEVTVSHKYTCHGICMLNMVGTGFFHPGDTIYVDAASEGSTDQEAVKNLYRICQNELKVELDRASDVDVNKQASSISGIVPVSVFNKTKDSLDYVQYFDKILEPKTYCRRN